MAWLEQRMTYRVPLTGPRLGKGSLNSADTRLMANESTLEAKQSAGRNTTSQHFLRAPCCASSCNSGAQGSVCMLTSPCI